MNSKFMSIFVSFLIYISAKYLDQACSDGDADIRCKEEETEHFTCVDDRQLERDPEFPDKILLELYTFTGHLRDLILRLHNEYRDKTASGSEVCNKSCGTYPGGRRMRELVLILAMHTSTNWASRHRNVITTMLASAKTIQIYAQIILSTIQSMWQQHERNQKNYWMNFRKTNIVDCQCRSSKI